MEKIISAISNVVWGPPVLILLIGTGLFLTLRTKGIQFRKLPYALKLAFSPHQDKNSLGDISHFEALMTALSATVGTGNIVGVATAVVLGGPGAMIWMWVSALVGMATKYGEAILAVKFRVRDEKGQMAGGPMYYLEKGLKCKWLGVLFAVFAVIASFGIGSGVQAQSVATALGPTFGIPTWIIAIVMVVTLALVILGGIQSIAKVVTFFVPIMIVFYVATSLVIIGTHLELLPATFSLIFQGAFSAKAIAGGVAGAAIRYGVARGVFSNEAGLGSSPIAAAAAICDHPGRQALVSMTQVFLDTIVVCSMTGLILIMGGQYDDGLKGAALTMSTFDSMVGGKLGTWIVAIGLFMFAYSTIIGWSYYGERCAYYLGGQKVILPYRIVYIAVAGLGCVATNLDMIWNISDVFNGFMAIPNLIGLLGLSGIIAKETKDFNAIIKAEKAEAKALKQAVPEPVAVKK
jgi:AGCS family alanine or glycine:cation symporter